MTVIDGDSTGLIIGNTSALQSEQVVPVTGIS